ncbi:MAG TPA: methionyl-tRNA formyltransferase [Candidatus Paceibacterota bacterium]|nr:methionyl-tRNA formyltransferase [Candidatus Paceibacterota bacterium]
MKKKIQQMNDIRFVFFGTAPLAIDILDALEHAGYIPSLIVAGPDSLEPRKKTVVLPPEKVWALERSIEVMQPKKIDTAFIASLKKSPWDIFVVASYGKILPKSLLDIPKHGVLNVHPSLLPRLRGPSPIRSAILNDDRNIGVSIIVLDEQMDHGPIIAQKTVSFEDWPPCGRDLDALLAQEGGRLLAEYMPKWVRGEISAHEQNHDLATYCYMIKKEDGLIDLNADAYQNLLKIRAYDGWPGTYALFEKDDREMRVKILDALIVCDALEILRVIPEGKKEMSYKEFLRSGAKPL